jgi:hypothetical protein
MNFEVSENTSPLCPLSTNGEGKRFARNEAKLSFEELNPMKIESLFN